MTARPYRILLAMLTDPGHRHAILGVAQQLARAGHVLAVCAPEDLTTVLRRAGIEARCVAWGKAGGPRALDCASYAKKQNNVRWQQKFMELALLAGAPEQVELIEALVRDFQPDVICANPMVYAAAIAAERSRTPWAGVPSNLLAVVPEAWRFSTLAWIDGFAPARQQLFERHGVEARFRSTDVISPWLNVAFTTDAFVPPALSPSQDRFLVGPSTVAGARGDEPDFAWDRVPAEGPLVYVTFGSQVAPPEPVVIDMLRELARDAHVVASVKDQLAAVAAAVPPNVTCVPYAPQLALIARADVVIHHGGASSTMECLSHGKPALVLPLSYDQPVQARLVAESGAGRMLEPSQITGARCRELVAAMLPADAPERIRAAEIARSYAAHDGAAGAARLIEELARARQPRTPA